MGIRDQCITTGCVDKISYFLNMMKTVLTEDGECVSLIY